MPVCLAFHLSISNHFTYEIVNFWNILQRDFKYVTHLHCFIAEYLSDVLAALSLLAILLKILSTYTSYIAGTARRTNGT